MCEFCIKHGEGKKWYLNVKNYNNDLINDIARKKFAENHFHWLDKIYKRYHAIDDPFRFSFIKPYIRLMLRIAIKKMYGSWHWSQVVPIEDAVKILDIAGSITRIPCVCRQIKGGKECRLCFLLTLNPEKLGFADIVDKSFLKGPDLTKFEVVSKQWAINLMKDSELKGMVHTVWVVGAPFIGFLCNCDLATGCLAMEMIKNETPFTFKAEYIAEIDKDKCIGCKECIKICPFNAIIFDEKSKKASSNLKRCYGCGICRGVCKKNAINLKERNAIVDVAHLW